MYVSMHTHAGIRMDERRAAGNDVIYLIAVKIDSTPALPGNGRLVQAIHSREVRAARRERIAGVIEEHLRRRVPIDILRDRNIYRDKCFDLKSVCEMISDVLQKRRNHYESVVITGVSSKLMPSAVKLNFFLKKRMFESAFK